MKETLHADMSQEEAARMVERAGQSNPLLLAALTFLEKEHQADVAALAELDSINRGNAFFKESDEAMKTYRERESLIALIKTATPNVTRQAAKILSAKPMTVKELLESAANALIYAGPITRSLVGSWIEEAIPALEEPPTEQWRCFHCDEVFTSKVDARAHFGREECSEPACRIKAPGEFALLQALRNMEDQLARYRAEDSDILRAMHSQAADHAQALRREEEKGYARGLEDAKQHPETIGLVRADDATLAAAVRDMLATECSVPAPYCGNAMDPVNDLRLVSGRRLEKVRAALPKEPADRILPAGWASMTPDQLAGAEIPKKGNET